MYLLRRHLSRLSAFTWIAINLEEKQNSTSEKVENNYTDNMKSIMLRLSIKYGGAVKISYQYSLLQLDCKII